MGPGEDERSLQGPENQLSHRSTFGVRHLLQPRGNATHPGVEDSLAGRAQYFAVRIEIKRHRRYRASLCKLASLEAGPGLRKQGADFLSDRNRLTKDAGEAFA